MKISNQFLASTQRLALKMWFQDRIWGIFRFEFETLDQVEITVSNQGKAFRELGFQIFGFKTGWGFHSGVNFKSDFQIYGFSFQLGFRDRVGILNEGFQSYFFLPQVSGCKARFSKQGFELGWCSAFNEVFQISLRLLSSGRKFLFRGQFAGFHQRISNLYFGFMEKLRQRWLFKERFQIRVFK